MHRERARAGSFGAEAERYDRTRPRYPAVLLDDLLAGGTPDVLDVGCGTGIASAAFAERGCAVLGVEPDARMAAVAERKGIPVEVATFEEWDARGRTFDLVVSGQAWHWVDPDRGAAKAAEVLRPNGRLAVFWNVGAQDPATRAALDEVYDRLAPQLRDDSPALGTRPDVTTPGAAAVAASRRFTAPDIRAYEWTLRYSTSEWLDMLATFSNHVLLPEDTRAALLADLGATIDGLGGGLTLDYRTVVAVATRV